MLAESLNSIFGGGVGHTNGENRIDDAERDVVVAIFFCMGQVGKVEFGFAIGDKIKDINSG